MRVKNPARDLPETDAENISAGPRRPARGRKVPRKVSAQSLENAALYYLARFSAPSAHLRRVLLRRVERSVRVHGGDTAEGRRLVDALIERFRRSGLVDDAAYAAGKARSLRRRGTSRVVIGRALRAKGLTAAETDAALTGLTEESGRSTDEIELMAAARLAQRKRLGPFRPKTTRGELRERDMAALARAGFSYDVARRVIEADSAGTMEAMIRGESEAAT